MADVLERSFSVSEVNALANHPSIRPHIGPELDGEELDFAPVVHNDRNVCLMGEHGGFVYTWSAPHCYEIHTIIRKEGHGKWALNAVRESLAHMVANYGAKHIWTRVLPEQRNVRVFTITVGFKPCGQEVFDIGGGPTIYNLYDWRPSCL